MATRFLAIVSKSTTFGNVRSHPVSIAADLKVVLSTSRLKIFVSTTGAYVPFSSSEGVVIGHLFEKAGDYTRVTALDAQMTTAISKSPEHWLLDHFWGGYVSFTLDPATDDVRVLREPSGTLPCLYVDQPDATYIASDIEMLLSAGIDVPDVNWFRLSRFLLNNNLPESSTALCGIFELLPGDCLLCGADNNFVSTAWSPWNYTTPIPDISDAELVARLRDTVTKAVRAWGSCFDHVLLGVSGGLDSSIVAATLAGSTDVTCFTMATDEAEGDERHYARIVTEDLGLSLLEAFYRLDEVDLLQPTGAHLPIPGGHPALQTSNKVRQDIIRDRGIDALFTGAGGDNVFCYMQSATPLVDRLQVEGFGMGLWQTLNDICRLTGCSYWDAIKMAAQKRQEAGPAYQWRSDPFWLAPAMVLEQAGTAVHHWLDAHKAAQPGKAVHIAALLRILSAPDILPRPLSPSQILPLLSQPIVELCLSIPSWKWIAGGQNRSLVRQAFGSVLPPAIINRRSKGGPRHFSNQIIESNRQLIGANLCDGLLAQNGIIDVSGLQDVLTQQRPFRQEEIMRLISIAEAEAWAKAWNNRKTVPGFNTHA